MAVKRSFAIDTLYRKIISTRANKTGDWRLFTPVRVTRDSPCREGCPLKGEIPLWLEAVKTDHWDEAWEIMRRSNPFPAITGSICFHPCTEKCNQRHLDKEIDIPAVERAIGCWRQKHYRPPVKPRAVRESVAVIGAGPAGLSCAYYLNDKGYRVTVIEKAPVAGGLLALGIPHYRLPREILHRELEILRGEGILFVFNCSLGRDLDLAQLYEEYDRVFLATGAWVSRLPAISGVGLSGVWNALDFLYSINLDRPPVPVSGPVAVVGGGNAAVDAARSALRLEGINRVTILYRRGKEEMPAEPREVEAAVRDGVEFIFNVIPREIKGDQGRLVEIALSRSHTSGGKPAADPAVFSHHECKTLIFAVGQEPDLNIFGHLPRSRTLFAGGDLLGGPATVPDAIKAGRTAATAIVAQLQGRPFSVEEASGKAVTFEELQLFYGAATASGGRREDPVQEAARCLGCGSCNACGICHLFCPDMAVTSERGRYNFDLDYCKGCGICARECPARALIMEGGRQ